MKTTHTTVLEGPRKYESIIGNSDQSSDELVKTVEVKIKIKTIT